MHPALFLALLILITAAAWGIHAVRRRRRCAVLRKLAAQWQMRFVPHDLFQLARRIEKNFPLADVTDLHARDVIYGACEQCHRYLFTVEYTLPTEDSCRRIARAMVYCDPGGPRSERCAAPLTLAPEELTLAQQYQYLFDTLAPCPATPKS